MEQVGLSFKAQSFLTHVRSHGGFIKGSLAREKEAIIEELFAAGKIRSGEDHGIEGYWVRGMGPIYIFKGSRQAGEPFPSSDASGDDYRDLDEDDEGRL